ncbi:MAG TPA: DUF6797 domain-containing protein [Candidatus Limnocylindria bacterium]|nr:DUF6797 domain-containing protein [Candidatus Limnocylindria bacterium]
MTACKTVRASALPGLLAAGLLLGTPLFGAEKPADESLLQKNFPFQGACISAKFPEKNVAMKGLAIRLGNGANILWDTDLCRVAAGWTGGYISTFGVAFDGGHGGHPAIMGNQAFGTATVPGVTGPDGAFRDPRSEPFGPVDSSIVRWDGIHLDGMDVQLNYTVGGGTKVHEQPSSVSKNEQIGFVRTFQLELVDKKGAVSKTGKTAAPFAILIADVTGATGTLKGDTVTFTTGDTETKVSAVGLPKGAQLKVEGGRATVAIAAGTDIKSPFKVVVWNGSTAEDATFAALADGAPVFKNFTQGGARRWYDTVATKGVVGKDEGSSYVVDNITPPVENPWKRRVRLSGMDFFSDGTRAALSTWDGDIWIVSGIDQGLENLQWRRFASGMYETLGLKIVNDTIYTSGRDQITRYTDLNKDGEADYYENFNNNYTSSEGFHEFVFDLQTDAQNNFYFAKAGPVRPGGRGFERIAKDSGTLMKISADGRTKETIATGFRAPNGIAINPWNGQITTGDNEGSWVPTCPVNWVKKGGFYGVEDLAHGADVKTFQEPLTWMSHDEYDNSGGGQVWVNSDRWGPFSKRLLHMSYGQCALYLVMAEEAANGQMQGGVVRFPVKFASSAMRARFNQADGQLYVCGLQGWQTKAVKISGFDRVRYTGKPVYTVEQIHYTPTGIRMTFTQPLDAKEASDAQNYSVRRWNYHRSSDYGSPTFSVKNPEKKGRDTVEVTGAKLLEDGKTVELKVDDFRTVQQMEVKLNIKAKDGKAIEQEFQCTVNVVPATASVR